jgi:8-oxo-dGTP pyrophosphatase MutT (NUDIX family)
MVIMEAFGDFRLVKKEGITAVIISRKGVLVMKRIALPFLIDSGVWTFVAGSREKEEKYVETAYREVREETGLDKENLILRSKYEDVVKIDMKSKTKYHNHLYIFYSKTINIRKNIENSAYRWAPLSEIQEQRKYTNVFADKQFIEKEIKRAIDAERLAKS